MRCFLPFAKKHLKLKEYKEAILWLNTTIQNHEDLANAYYLRAFAFNKISDKNKALSDLRKAAECGNNKAIDILRKRTDSN
ncbi:MAG: hypothetical protein D3923_10815 [Candidatus Electrothrix sp. AR3]|nr:hypothetical protein [Candidatus Electrothrix sp. AR3]